MKNLKEKPFVVIDLGSGSYLRENEGHEKFNEVPNSVNGKYYGYAPAYGNLKITNFGAKRSDEYITGVLVIYVKKLEGSSDRYISSYIDDATVYAKPRIDKSLKRKVQHSGKYVDCSYCIESDMLYNLNDLSAKDKFIIKLSDYSRSMFRKQRFYKGTYPTLDNQIIEYLENISIFEREFDDNLFQQELQEYPNVSIPKMKHNALSEPEYSEGINGKQVKKKIGVSKAALALAGYTCEASSEHVTFTNRNGVSYMEGHHLIPCTPSNAFRYWNKFRVNIDCMENIICLCPTCHRLLHYGSEEERNELLKELYSIRKERLKEIGINISFKELLSLYS